MSSTTVKLWAFSVGWKYHSQVQNHRLVGKKKRKTFCLELCVHVL